MSDVFVYDGQELRALGEAKNYCRWIISYFAPHLGSHVMEVGAGVGAISSLLLEQPGVSDLVLLEPADNLFPLLRDRFARDSRVTLVHGHVEDMAGSSSVDSVVLVNVLEHIEDDLAALRTIHGLLKPGGTVLLFVPALPWLFGSLDRSFGHFRRYEKLVLTDRLRMANFKIEYCRYLNFPGILSWFIAGKLLKQETLRLQDVKLYDRWIIPWVSRFERLVVTPCGQSLIVIARK